MKKLEYYRKYYKENKETIRKYQREWKRNNRLSAKNSKLKTKYGITLDEFEVLLAEQGGKCAICLMVLVPHERNRRDGAHVDHCHATGVIRGILCPLCNSGIGMLGDTLEGILRAANYLAKSLEREQ